MSDESVDDVDEPMSLRAKVIAGAVLVVVLAGSALFLMRLGSPAIGPSRTAPAGHYPLPCALCHTITADTPTVGTP